MSDRIIAPSMLSCDFGRIAEEAQAVVEAGADWIHLDVMDGCFVPNISFGAPIVEAVRRAVDVPLDVHLMIEQPERYLEDFIDAGADYLTVHVEATRHLHRCLSHIHEYGESRGVKAGVSLNPHTPVCAFSDVLDDIDLVLFMSVNPGFGGQKFIPQVLKKIKEFRELIANRGDAAPVVMVDGGIKPHNIGDVAQAGANAFVAGSVVFGSKNYAETITALRNG